MSKKNIRKCNFCKKRIAQKQYQYINVCKKCQKEIGNEIYEKNN